MAFKTIDQNPTIFDTVVFDLTTPDATGTLTNPFEVNTIIIYFIERSYEAPNFQEFSPPGSNPLINSFFFKDAVPFAVFGTPDFPAWLSTDIPHALIENTSTGHFELEWTPELAREGDYLLCYTWTSIAGGDTQSTVIRFFLSGQLQSPVIPSHQTAPNKYQTLLDRYLPDMFKQFLGNSDITPNVLENMNLALVDAFTLLENLADQLYDLNDANVVNEALLPYIASFFKWKLRSQDPLLWRRQLRQAIPLYKQKGTIAGLSKALDECGAHFTSLNILWQVVSPSTWQEAFVVTKDEVNNPPIVFKLQKYALLPVEPNNFKIFYRAVGQSNYVQLTLNYVSFSDVPGTNVDCANNTNNTTFVTWVGDSLLINPITLNVGDVVRILYKVFQPADQNVENYIQSLPLADQRDETTVTFPLKNWNVRVIAENDAFFPLICPISPCREPFQYPVVFGKARTEFPYSENIYNMEEYNGSIRDSTNPCDIDANFLDSCSCCKSSKFTIDVEIESLSNDRIKEIEEVITDFVPFHAVLHSINFTGLNDEIVAPPVEEIECLVTFEQDDIVFDPALLGFSRLIRDGKNFSNELSRNMLTNSAAVASGNDGVGYNEAIVFYSPGINFDDLAIKPAPHNILEVLSGSDMGTFQISPSGPTFADIIQGSPSTVGFPLDTSGFPFRLSNIQFQESTASIFQDNVVSFIDPNVNFSLFPITDDSTWVLIITSGLYAGNYPIIFANSDNTLNISGWTGPTLVAGLNYEIKAPSNIVVVTGVGGVSVTLRGRVETQLIQNEYDVKAQDYLIYNGVQYLILAFGTRQPSATVDKVYIGGYSSGNVVGVANIQIWRRMADNKIGYFSVRGLRLHTTIDYETTLGISNGSNETPTLDDNNFKENFLVLIGSNYYQIVDINHNNIFLAGPAQSWGLTGTLHINYTIIHFTKLTVMTEDGLLFPFVDRRGDVPPQVIQQNLMLHPSMRLKLLNSGAESIMEAVKGVEEIWYEVELKEN